MVFGKDACPAESFTGGSTGEDTSMAGFDNTEQAVDVYGWDQAGDTRAAGGSHDLQPIRFVTHARRVGQVTTVEVPQTPGGPPDGESALRRVHHVFAPRTLGKRAYMRTPGKCPRSGYWAWTGEFTFADGVVERDVYHQPCT
jgi:hypothetical protein